MKSSAFTWIIGNNADSAFNIFNLALLEIVKLFYTIILSNTFSKKS